MLLLRIAFSPWIEYDALPDAFTRLNLSRIPSCSMMPFAGSERFALGWSDPENGNVRSRLPAVLLDLAVVLLFATVGRGSHAEGITAAGVLDTATAALPDPLCEATPLAGSETLNATAPGVLAFAREPGQKVQISSYIAPRASSLGWKRSYPR